MVSKNQPDWLPTGWKLQIKVKNGRKFKCYVHSKTCEKLYSRLAVLRYINNGSVANDSSDAAQEHAKKISQEREMQLVVADDSLKWLPAGWTVEAKIRQSGAKKGTSYKCFIDPSSGSKFYSKPEVFRYLQSIQNSAGQSGREERRSTRHSSSNRPVDQLKALLSNVEPTVSHNSKTKTTTNRRLSSGKKEPNASQNSKTTASKRLSLGEKEPNVSQNTKVTASKRLSSGNKKPNVSHNSKTTPSWRISSGKKEPNLSHNSKTTASRSLSSEKKEVVIENTVDEDLPSGWIKEMRKKVCGTKVVRTDPFYYHPASGLVFRSKLEVLRYLETGEISRHAYWRRNYADKEELAIEKTSPTPSVKPETTTNRNIKKELFAGEETSKGSPSLMPEARVVKEAAVRRITRSSSRVRPASVGDVKPDQSSLSPEVQDDICQLKDSSPLAIELPSTSTMNILTVENTIAVSMKGCSNKKTQTTKRKMKDQKLLSVPSRASKRLAGIDAQAVFHSTPVEHALRAKNKKSTRAKPVPSLVNAPNDLQGKPKPPDAYTQNASVSQLAKHCTLDVSTETVLATEEPQNNSDSLMQNSPLVFSENEVIDAPSINAERSSENPINASENPINAERSSENSMDHPVLDGKPDALLGSKIERVLPGCPITEEQPGSIGRDAEQSGSEFSFPPPLWSDPCLEFAYKTLTGAIPLDDNLAIEDYIQYQLRTSKQSNDFQSLPDIDMASFPQNDETKLVPPSPEGIRLPNGNGLAPDKTSR